MTQAKKILHAGIIFCISLLSVFLQGCVHEFPDYRESVEVRLHITHTLPWDEYDFHYGSDSRNGKTRSPDERYVARYFIRVYPEGNTRTPARSVAFYREDPALVDFDTELTLPPGKWDIYVWQHLDTKNGVPSLYNVDEFKAITYNDPYRGDTDTRDAFEGRVSLDIPAALEEGSIMCKWINMDRPLAKYVFISTDLEEFYFESLTRFGLPKPDNRWETLSPAQQKDALEGFIVTTRYPLFMPSVYNMISQKVIDSRTGMRFDSFIQPLSAQEAIVAKDYVFIDRKEGGVQVQLGLRAPNGSQTGLTSTITVPLRRGQITYVRGRFLTNSSGNGMEIDFSFSGNINIPIL